MPTFQGFLFGVVFWALWGSGTLIAGGIAAWKYDGWICVLGRVAALVGAVSLLVAAVNIVKLLNPEPCTILYK